MNEEPLEKRDRQLTNGSVILPRDAGSVVLDLNRLQTISLEANILPAISVNRV